MQQMTMCQKESTSVFEEGSSFLKNERLHVTLRVTPLAMTPLVSGGAGNRTRVLR